MPNHAASTSQPRYVDATQLRCPDFNPAVMAVVRELQRHQLAHIVTREPSAPRDMTLRANGGLFTLYASETDKDGVHHFIVGPTQ